MSLRPAAARWFELLTARDDAAVALERLARTGAVELEIRSADERFVSFRDIRGQVEQFRQLERRYRAYWPGRDADAEPSPGGPDRALKAALRQLYQWEQPAAPLIAELESLSATQRDLNLFADMLELAGDAALDYALLAGAGRILATRLFVLPPHSRLDIPAAALLVRHYTGGEQDFVLVVGTSQSLETAAPALAVLKARAVPIPDFIGGNSRHALARVQQRLAYLDAQVESLRHRIATLAQSHRLAQALGAIQRLDWFLNQVERLPVTPSFAWITGWTDAAGSAPIEAALAAGRVGALVHFPAPPPGLRPPMVLRNPAWGRPFEPFVRMLGVPAAGEADPSSLLALLVPLMFGYMFGDVGQGLVLVAAGLLLRRRWPLLQILLVNGCAAILFGFVFGSVFGREDIISPLWIQPLAQPLAVLQAPLVGGALVLLLGLALKGLQYHWQGAAAQWWRVEAPMLLLYVCALTAPFTPAAAAMAAPAVVWYLAGSWLQRRADPARGMLAALGELVEDLLQLLINTLSFVRVGAFALAHAGLALAFATLAAMPENRLMAFVILLLGNLVIIVLEGLVVTIQTTRLVLFEFFTRFMRAGGRVFHPLVAPTERTPAGGEA